MPKRAGEAEEYHVPASGQIAPALAIRHIVDHKSPMMWLHRGWFPSYTVRRTSKSKNVLSVFQLWDSHLASLRLARALYAFHVPHSVP